MVRLILHYGNQKRSIDISPSVSMGETFNLAIDKAKEFFHIDAEVDSLIYKNNQYEITLKEKNVIEPEPELYDEWI